MTGYKYYKEDIREEHLLFVEEIHELFWTYFAVDETLKPSLIHTMIRRYGEKHNVEIEKLYYQTRNGLKRVYSLEIAGKALRFHFEPNEEE